MYRFFLQKHRIVSAFLLSKARKLRAVTLDEITPGLKSNFHKGIAAIVY